jgi:hypothetical protein
MWLLERLYPDYKSIAEFRRIHREAVTAAGAERVCFAKNCGLIRGEWIAVDGSKFRAVASIDTAREKFQLQRYLDSMEKLDRDQSPEFDSVGVQAALEKLKHHPEPEVGFMVMGRHTQPAYNLQSAVDAEHALIIAHDVVLDAADNRNLEPMADAAKAVLERENFYVVADAGYSNGEQAAKCEAKGIMPCVPATRTRNPHGDGTFFQCDAFRHPAPAKSKEGLNAQPLYLSSKGAREVPRLRRRLSSFGVRVAAPTVRLGEQTRAVRRQGRCGPGVGRRARNR